MQYPGANLEINDPNLSLKEDSDIDRLGIFYAGFIRKVYGILSAQLLVTIFFCGIVMSSEILTEFVQTSQAFFCIAVAGISASMSVLVYCKNIARKVPINYITLFIFTICESYAVAIICTYYDVYTVITAAVMTLGITLVITAYACLTKTDYEPFVGFVFIILSPMIMMIFFGFYFIGFGAIIYGIYIIVDTEFIADGKRHGITYDDYVIGAMIIYADVIELFIRIIQLIAKLGKFSKK